MLTMALIELFLLGLAIGWFGHMFHVWKKHHWRDSWLRKLLARRES